MISVAYLFEAFNQPLTDYQRNQLATRGSVAARNISFGSSVRPKILPSTPNNNKFGLSTLFNKFKVSNNQSVVDNQAKKIRDASMMDKLKRDYYNNNSVNRYN